MSKQDYYAFNTHFAAIGDKKLRDMLQRSKIGEGWGSTHELSILGKRVFAKKIAVTEKEYANRYSIENLYDLPEFYNYGLGSAGLGAFRELHAHISTTNWALENRVSGVPLMYHHRIMERIDPFEPIDELEHARSIKYWGSDKNIDVMLRERAAAPYELVLCLEWIPHCLGYRDWFAKNTHRINDAMESLFETFAQLSDLEFQHFDSNFNNFLTDGRNFYLSDFGLTLSRSNCKSDQEKAFYDRNTAFPYAGFMASTAWHLTHIHFDKLTEIQRTEINNILGNQKALNDVQLRIKFLNNLEKLNDGFFNLDPTYFAFLLKYREPILIASHFIHTMIASNAKDTIFPNEEFSQSMKNLGWAV